jgi:outer membrane protein TolC
VYNETALKYREGLATMSNLLQDEMSLNAAQANYLTALYNYKEAELKIMSLNGQISEL